MMDPIIYHEELRGKFEIKSRAKLATREDLSLAYTPGVAKVCEAIVENPARVYDLTRKNNLVAVVTDGSAVLGLGNIGPEASLPVMEGKCILYKEFSDVDAVPIALKTQDTEEIIRTVELISPMFGGIHLEDISAPRCFEIEERLDKMLDIPVFHDDQQGTAVVVLAAILNALELVDKKIEEKRVVVNGVGAAGVAITKLLMAGGVKNLYLVDSKGIVYDGRGDLNDVKKDLAKITNPDKRTGGLIVAMIGADVFIGVSKGNVVSGEMVKSMGEKSIVMALANPTPEIMPDLARDSGAYIVASGRSDFPNQVNNVLSFPGIFRGLLDGKIKSLTVEMKLRAARALAEYVTDLSRDKILPNPLDKEVSKVISKAIQN